MFSLTHTVDLSYIVAHLYFLLYLQSGQIRVGKWETGQKDNT